MLRRVPPVLLALGATVVLVGVVIGVFVGLGGGSGRSVPTCSQALDDGPFGCVVFVSVSGSVAGVEATEPSGGGITFRIERAADGGSQLIYSAGRCGGGEGPVAVTPTRFRVGTLLSGRTACEGGDDTEDAWARRLLTGTVAVTERDDASVELAHGDLRAVFAEVVAPRS